MKSGIATGVVRREETGRMDGARHRRKRTALLLGSDISNDRGKATAKA